MQKGKLIACSINLYWKLGIGHLKLYKVYLHNFFNATIWKRAILLIR